MSSKPNDVQTDISTNPIGQISIESFCELSDLTRQESIVLDLGQAQTYSRGHLPGAVHLPVARIVRQSGYSPGLLPTPASLHQLAEDYGFGEGKTIYVYDDEGGGWAGRMVWILDILNIPNVVYIDGGLRAWLQAGFKLDGERHEPIPGKGVTTLSLWPNVDLAQMIELVQAQSVDFLDARSRAEYIGERQFAQKTGRIPGSVHFEWTRGMELEEGFSVRPLDILRQELLDIGIDGQKPIVTYCQTHHRSGFTYLLCRLLDYPVRAYAGSWSEWGNQSDTPIEKG